MPTPSTGAIAFSDVRTELGQSNPAEMSTFYDTANTGGNSGLMYHNLNMVGGSTTARVAIYNNYNAGTNYKLTNWYNYTQDIGLVITYLITNSSSYNVTFNLAIWDSSNTNVGTIFNGFILNGTNTGTQTVDTGCLSGTVTAGYRIAIQDIVFTPGPTPIPPAPPVIPSSTFAVTITVNSASDTDGVGAGTTRTTYGPFSYSETQNQPPAPSPPTPFTASVATDTSGSTIFNNKRTTISITIS
jgi:hypothetical protein